MLSGHLEGPFKEIQEKDDIHRVERTTKGCCFLLSGFVFDFSLSCESLGDFIKTGQRHTKKKRGDGNLLIL